jgi:class 3 adenylate cyclase/DNA-binding winged helix-turn-helix (wHTH) protein
LIALPGYVTRLGAQAMHYVLGPYTLDTQSGELRHAEAVVPLEPKAYKVLVYLVEQRHRIVTKAELLDQVRRDVYVDDSVVSRCIVALRRALGDSPETQQAIQTRRGYGYRFVMPVVCQDRPVTGPAATPSLPLPPASLQEPLPHAPAPTVAPPEPVALPPPSWDTLSNERKVVTVLCCRLAETAATAERLDLDEQHAILQSFFELLTPEIKRYGGSIQPMLGEGFLALFGAPTAYEDHAQRAVLAAIGLRDRWQTQQTEADAVVREAFTLHLGAHTGLMVISHTGGAALLPYTAGDTTTLAIRLTQHTVPGTIALSETTAQLVGRTVRVEALGPGQTISGTPSVPGYHVLGVAPRRSPMLPRGERMLTPFVGREQELTALHTLLAQVEQGRGQVVGLVGEPGIGKSRLLSDPGKTRVADRCGHGRRGPRPAPPDGHCPPRNRSPDVPRRPPDGGISL